MSGAAKSNWLRGTTMAAASWRNSSVANVNKQYAQNAQATNRRASNAISRQLYLAELKRLEQRGFYNPQITELINNQDEREDDEDEDENENTPGSAAFIKRMTIRRRMSSTCFDTGIEHQQRLFRPSEYGSTYLLGSPSFQLTDSERRFIDAIERGDRHAVKAMLEETPRVNVNCRDIIGRTALEIAVDNENAEIVKILIHEKDIRIGNALLHAVHEGSFKIVEMLTRHEQITAHVLGSEWPAYRGDGETFYNYPNYISPIVLAAQRNAFEILQLFLSRGAVIDKPHLVTCTCRACEEERAIDSLRFSLKRINIYSALASPAWICLTSSDPVLTAFKLSHKLEVLADVENEFRDAYVKMSRQCKAFVCDLLDECRSTDEVAAILALDVHDMQSRHQIRRGSDLGYNNGGSVQTTSGMSLGRLKLAIKYKQKQFVTHPHCQQVLANLWYGNIGQWRQFRFLVKLLLCIGLIVAFPISALVYLCAPKSRVGLMIRSPFMKFLYHSTSFGIFLALLVMAGSEMMYEDGRRDTRGPSPSAFEWLLCLYVLGFIWNECKQVYSAGFKTYVKEWWNWLDFTMITLYLSSICLRSVAYFQLTTNNAYYGPRVVTRALWPKNDPTLVSEALFAIANVFSFARIIFLFQANPHLGPLQISLGCMIIDISKFLLIFFLILTSFACGLNQLYWFYSAAASSTASADRHFGGRVIGADSAEAARTYTTLLRSYLNLFWSLFGHTNVLTLSVPGDHLIVEAVGELLLLAYHAMAIIVLLNMLIAMMSNSFQNITANSDIEWKFARTKLWMSYFDEGGTLPPPFNIIISPKSIYYTLRKVFCYTGKKHAKLKHTDSELQSSPSKLGKEVVIDGDFNDKTEPSPDSKRRELLKKLIGRYMAVIKKRLRAKDVNADDLLEIKQDISSLRFELKETARREMLLHNKSLRGLKNDICQTLAGTRRKGSLTRQQEKVVSSRENSNEVDEEDEAEQMVPTTTTGQQLVVPKIVTPSSNKKRPHIADIALKLSSSQDTATTSLGGTSGSGTCGRGRPTGPHQTGGRSDSKGTSSFSFESTSSAPDLLFQVRHNLAEIVRQELVDFFGNKTTSSPTTCRGGGGDDYLSSRGSHHHLVTVPNLLVTSASSHQMLLPPPPVSSVSLSNFAASVASVGNSPRLGLNHQNVTTSNRVPLFRSRRVKEPTLNKEDEQIYQV